MIGSASAAAVTKTPLSLRARPAADTDRLDQHDFSHNDEPWDRPAILGLAHDLASALGLDLSEAALGGIRTREDLIDLVLNEITEKAPADAVDNDGSTIRVRITAKRAPEGYVERSLPWTPYALETIWEDAVHAGSGSVVDVTTPYGTPRSSIARLEQRFAPLRYRGVRVRVRSDSAAGRSSPLPPASGATEAAVSGAFPRRRAYTAVTSAPTSTMSAE